MTGRWWGEDGGIKLKMKDPRVKRGSFMYADRYDKPNSVRNRSSRTAIYLGRALLRGSSGALP